MSAVVKALQAAGQGHASALKRHALLPLNHLRMLALELGRGRMEAAPVDEGELQRIWPQVQAWLHSDRPAKVLPLSVWKRVPSLLWWPHEGQLAITHLRLREGIAWAASMSVPRVSWVEALASAYTEALDPPEESHRWLGNTLRQWCEVELSNSLEVWRRRDRDWGLWSPADFPAKLARRLQSSPGMSALGALIDAGLSNARSHTAELSRHAFLACLNLSVTAAQGYDTLHLERIREWKTLLVGESSAWTKSLSAAVINGLLEPWASFNPPDVAFQKKIQKETLESWFGPVPERWSGHWAGASTLSREILARWKILDVMEAFFQRVGDYAKETGNATMTSQWPYRRKFWLAYYKKGAVTHARALIGRGMMARYGMQALQEKFGRAMAALQANDAQQCGLLLQINELVVVDLSHNGAAYFFLPTSTHKPSTSASNYDRSRLGVLKDEVKAHYGSQAYLWQSSFAEFIFDHTGVSVKHSDYSLRA